MQAPQPPPPAAAAAVVPAQERPHEAPAASTGPLHAELQVFTLITTVVSQFFSIASQLLMS